MFQFGLFQPSFQIVPVQEDNGWLGGGRYVQPYTEYKNKEYRRKQEAQRLRELQRVNEEIAIAERKRQEALEKLKAQELADKAAKKLAALEARLQSEISELRNERVRLMRLIDDEDAILAILFSLPF